MNLEYMKCAIKKANESDLDIPIGAVIVKDSEILACCHNLKEKNNDATAHAEILAIRDASRLLGNWRLDGCDLYVTLEPCPMCAAAIMQSRISNLYFGAFDNIYGAFSTLPELQLNLNSKLNIKGGILEVECKKLLDEYFNKIRDKNEARNKKIFG